MVNERGQLYTMEGVAAGVIMLLTAYIVVSTTSVYTAGDTHIPDMQLEQLGSDVLAMMDTPDTEGAESDLESFISASDGDGFKNAFLSHCNMVTSGPPDYLNMSANVTYRSGNNIKEYQFVEPPGDGSWTGRESAVRVTRWVQLDSQSSPSRPYGTRAQAVLVEVLLWRA